MARETKVNAASPAWEALNGAELAKYLAASVERHFRGVDVDGTQRTGFDTGATMRNARQLDLIARKVLADPFCAGASLADQIREQPLPYTHPVRETVEEPTTEEAAA